MPNLPPFLANPTASFTPSLESAKDIPTHHIHKNSLVLPYLLTLFPLRFLPISVNDTAVYHFPSQALEIILVPSFPSLPHSALRSPTISIYKLSQTSPLHLLPPHLHYSKPKAASSLYSSSSHLLIFLPLPLFLTSSLFSTPTSIYTQALYSELLE